MSRVAWSVCLSVYLCVGQTDVLWKNGWTDRDAVLGAESCGSKELCIRWFEIGRIHSQPQGVPIRPCGLLPTLNTRLSLLTLWVDAAYSSHVMTRSYNVHTMKLGNATVRHWTPTVLSVRHLFYSIIHSIFSDAVSLWHVLTLQTIYCSGARFTKYLRKDPKFIISFFLSLSYAYPKL